MSKEHSTYMLYLSSGTQIKVFSESTHRIEDFWQELKATDVFYADVHEVLVVTSTVVAVRQQTIGTSK